MEPLPKDLLSAALHVYWEHGHAEDPQAVELIAQRIPNFSTEQYTEASRLAAELSQTAFDQAAVWFGSKGDNAYYPTVDGLEKLCPGFSRNDYEEAISNNILWARM